MPVIPFPYDGRPGEMRELHSYADGDFLYPPPIPPQLPLRASHICIRLLPRAAALAVRGYAQVPLPIFVDSQLSAQVLSFVFPLGVGAWVRADVVFQVVLYKGP